MASFEQDRFRYCASAAQILLQTSIVCLAAIERRKKKLNETNDGHQVLLLLHGGVGKVLGGLIIPTKVTMEMNQVLIEQGDLLYKYLEQFFLA